MHPEVEAVMMAYHRRFRRIFGGFLLGLALFVGPLAGYLAVGNLAIALVTTALMVGLILALLATERRKTLPVEEIWGLGPDAIRERIGTKVHEGLEPLAGGVLMVPKYPWVAPVWLAHHGIGATVVTGHAVAAIWRRHVGAPVVSSKPSK